jgi:hypothetical protein
MEKWFYVPKKGSATPSFMVNCTRETPQAAGLIGDLHCASIAAWRGIHGLASPPDEEPLSVKALVSAAPPGRLQARSAARGKMKKKSGRPQ